MLPYVRWIVLLGEVNTDDCDAIRTMLKETILKSQSTGLSVAAEVLKACPLEDVWKKVRLPGGISQVNFLLYYCL